ncbi:MAG TPA: hypothetical protein VKG01_18175, partial [Thermoanaerobaculia bacterium]|nr:hypothetical protein [Thermoanaerobaculia bacterium]
MQLAYYTIEYRQPFGVFEHPASTLYQGVMIYAAPDFPTQAETGDYHFLLDMTPSTSTMSDAALTVGQTFTDPAG